jgi:aryl-alcohol dehydrogenase-like predicted oxidoreductase
MNRRTFLRTTGLGAVGLNAFPYHLFASDTKKYATDRIRLGPRKIEVSRLAMGTGTHGFGGGSDQTRKLGHKGIAELMRAAYDQGVTFWDSADQYGSHTHLREALKTVPREKVTILTKTNSRTAADVKADIDRFRKELGTDYIDILLLHNMQDAQWNVTMRPAMDVISEAREKGIVRTHGTSCHTLGALKTAAAEPWVEVDLARINPAQLHMDSDPDTVLSVLRQMKQAGKGVIGMKILGQGGLRGKADEALQYALSHQPQAFDGFTIGSESRAEMEDLLRKIPAASVRA